MQIANIVRGHFGQRDFVRGAPGEVFVAFACTALTCSGGSGHLADLFWVDENARIAAHQLYRELVDIAFLAAKGRRQRQRHRPGTGIDASAEQRGEIGAGLGDQRDAVLRLDAPFDQAIGHRDRVFAHFRIGINALQLATHVVEVQPLLRAGGIVECLVEGRKLGADARQLAIVRCRHECVVGRSVVHCVNKPVICGASLRALFHP